jgi:rhodanese-related sulfurtransferase
MSREESMILFGNINRGLEEYRATSGAILVDVREADEFRSGHIPGAVNAPLSTITSTTLPKTAPLFLYCLRGSRSKRAAGILKRMGYTVKSIGGINGYKGEVKR